MVSNKPPPSEYTGELMGISYCASQERKGELFILLRSFVPYYGFLSVVFWMLTLCAKNVLFFFTLCVNMKLDSKRKKDFYHEKHYMGHDSKEKCYKYEHIFFNHYLDYELLTVM